MPLKRALAGATLLLVLLPVLAVDESISIQAGGLTVAVDSGPLFAYSVLVAGVPWFSAEDYVYSQDGITYSSANGTLSGRVGMNTPDQLVLEWSINSSGSGGGQPVWQTTFSRQAQGNNQSVLIFTQTFLLATNGILGTRFPTVCTTATAPRLGTLEYAGMSCGWMTAPHANFMVDGGNTKGYLVIAPLDERGEGTEATLVMGPASEFFANQAVSHDGSCISYGLASTFSFVPAGQTLTAILVASVRSFPSPSSATSFRQTMPEGGVNAALSEFGDFVLAKYNKTRSAPDINPQVEYLGYSTTGFYFYNLCDCLDPTDNIYTRTRCTNSPIPHCKTYSDTLVAVVEDLRLRGIPFNHILLDSWWYGENIHGGVWKWEDSLDVVNVSFPESLASFWQQLGKNITFWAHNGQWQDSPYEATYPFTEQMPQGDALWQYLFSQNRAWGLRVIKQDHMASQIRSAQNAAFSNISVLNSWLDGMGKAATDNDIGPNIHMKGVSVPAAFGVRASPDYVWQANGRILRLPQIQWAIGPDAAFHYNALGLLPYKDTFFSNSSASPRAGTWTKNTSQWVPFTAFTEKNPATHALISTLSMAQVTFSDGAGMANKTLLDFITRSDGKVLKPDRPVTAVDRQFQAMIFGSPGDRSEAALYLAPCSVSLASTQRFRFDSQSGTLSLTLGSKAYCVDISQCQQHDGALVHLFYNTAGCGQPPGTCAGKNELWQMMGNGQIVSRFNAKCLQATNDHSSVVNCAPVVPNTQWALVQSSNGTFLLQARDGQCLTGGLSAMADLESDFLAQGISPNYAAAYAESSRVLNRIQSRKTTQKNGVCVVAPQGPDGEIYTTHTKIGDYVWIYAVAIQLSRPFHLSVSDIGMLSSAYVAVPYSDARGFAPVDMPLPAFDASHPVSFQVLNTTGYPFQYVMLAPILPGNWILFGEGSKFVPISRQRLTGLTASTGRQLELQLQGAPGENVTFSAWQLGTPQVITQKVELSSEGVASLLFSAFPK